MGPLLILGCVGGMFIMIGVAVAVFANPSSYQTHNNHHNFDNSNWNAQEPWSPRSSSRNLTCTYCGHGISTDNFLVEECGHHCHRLCYDNKGSRTCEFCCPNEDNNSQPSTSGQRVPSASLDRTNRTCIVCSCVFEINEEVKKSCERHFIHSKCLEHLRGQKITKCPGCVTKQNTKKNE